MGSWGETYTAEDFFDMLFHKDKVILGGLASRQGPGARTSLEKVDSFCDGSTNL
jgi:hypothetical protein